MGRQDHPMFFCYTVALNTVTKAKILEFRLRAVMLHGAESRLRPRYAAQGGVTYEDLRISLRNSNHMQT
jgi:hypothetical protein